MGSEHAFVPRIASQVADGRCVGIRRVAVENGVCDFGQYWYACVCGTTGHMLVVSSLGAHP